MEGLELGLKRDLNREIFIQYELISVVGNVQESFPCQSVFFIDLMSDGELVACKKVDGVLHLSCMDLKGRSIE